MLLNSQMSLKCLSNVSNVLHVDPDFLPCCPIVFSDLPVSFLDLPLFSLLILYHPPVLLRFLTDPMLSSLFLSLSSHWFPPCSSHVSHCPPIDFLLDLSVLLLPILISLLSSQVPPWSLCSSHVSFIMILMMIAIKSIWWCPPPVIICSLMMFSACFISLIWLSWLIADYFYLKYLAVMIFISLVLVCYILKICFNRGL